MSLYKIAIKPVTSFCSPLQSDTFFGAFCWSYLYRYGEKALNELLHHYKTGSPDIIFSNAFPRGRLPMPIGAGGFKEKKEILSTKQERYKKYIINKKKEHLKTITLDEFNQVINGVEPSFSGSIITEEKTVSWRNMVSREAYTVESIGGEGSLFEVEETYSRGGYDIYIYSTLERNVLECTLKEMFQTGIGAQRSVGKGAFKITEELKIADDFVIPEKPNGFVALSNFVPQKQEPTEGYYRMLLKYPKVSYISDEVDSPFKKPLLFMEAGSVFYDQPVKPFYGSCIERVALKGGNISDEIVIGAYTVAIPCCMDC